MRIAPLVVAALAATPLVASARIIRVYPDGSGDAPTIAAAYAMASWGDDIVLGPGTYHEHDIVMKSVVDLLGESDDPTDTIVDAGRAGRCLDGGGVTGRPVIRGITFQGGRHATEGGLLLAGRGGTGGSHNAIYERCVFRDGAAPRGGAVATHASGGQAPVFRNCVFESNGATVTDGGAIWSAGVGSVESCTFRQNRAERHGGAIYSQKNYEWGLSAHGTLFEDNSAVGDGGAFYSTGVDILYGSWIEACRFEGNTATNGGAARLNQYDIVERSRFLRNTAAQDGGALRLLAIEPDKDLYGAYDWNVFAHNRAGSRGGAIAIASSSEFWLGNCTFARNEAPSGGHIWTSGWWGWGALINRSILAFATSGGAVAGTGSVASRCTDVFGNAGGDFVGPLAGGASEPTNLSEDPLFCDLVVPDLTLRTGSPCLPPLPEGCGTYRIGALGEGCGIIALERESWGSIKARYR